MDLKVEFLKSPNDKNVYKMVRLDNQLDCLLISDPAADKSAVSMSIDRGDLDDPDERPGMEHFLEHMLFMGTKKYPDQNSYSSYINENSGYNNAYTYCTHTDYLLDCSNEAFEGALDRFSQFFIAPLFDQSCVERELNAVNSENEMYINTDYWREYHLFRMSGKKGNPYSRFSVGNLKSLQHPTIRDEVVKFYNDNYSANIMKLCIYSNADIQILEEWAKKYFSEVPNKNYEARVFKEMPFTKENLGNIWKIVPIKDDDYLQLTWIFEGLVPHYKNNPVTYLSYLFGHEGENSLLAFLKEEGLATELSAIRDQEMNLFSSLSPRIKLTPLGYQNYKQVIGYVFQYLNMLKKYGAQKWFFEELQKTKNIDFLFLEKTDPITIASELSYKLHYHPPQDVLKLDYFMENYDENLINQTIQGLTLDNIQISLISKKCEPECNLVEEWYSIKHAVSPLDQEIIDYYHGKNLPVPKRTKRNLDLPPRNIFIPQNFDLYYKKEDNLPEEPQKILDNKLNEVWLKKDNKFLVPKAKISLDIYLKDASFGHSIETLVLVELWQKMFSYHTQEMIYLARSANIKLNIEVNPQGFSIDLNGYNDTILTLLVSFFEKILDFKPQDLEELFKDFHYQKLQEAKNFGKDTPYQVASNLIHVLAKVGYRYHPEKKIDALQRIKFEDLLALHKVILQKMKLAWLFAGNLREEDVLKAVAQIEDTLTNRRPGVKCAPLKDYEIPEIRPVHIPDNSTWVYEYNLTRDNPTDTPNSNSATFQLYQAKTHGHRTRVLNNLLENYLKESFFNQLRTNEQLGYCVWAYNQRHRGVESFVFLIQSDVKCPFYVRQRIATFLDSTKSKVENLSDDEFKTYVESIRTEYSKKPLQLFEEADNHWEEITTKQYYFNRNIKYAELIVPTITKQEFQDYVKDILYNAPRKLEVHVIPEPMKEENEKLKSENKEELRFIDSEDDFRRRVMLYPDFLSLPNNK